MLNNITCRILFLISPYLSLRSPIALNTPELDGITVAVFYYYSSVSQAAEEDD